MISFSRTPRKGWWTRRDDVRQKPFKLLWCIFQEIHGWGPNFGCQEYHGVVQGSLWQHTVFLWRGCAYDLRYYQHSQPCQVMYLQRQVVLYQELIACHGRCDQSCLSSGMTDTWTLMLMHLRVHPFQRVTTRKNRTVKVTAGSGLGTCQWHWN